MAERRTDRVENMIVAGLDQDYAAAVEHYEALGVEDRTELAEWLKGDAAALRDAPEWVLGEIQFLACTGFLEVGLRWAREQEAA